MTTVFPKALGAVMEACTFIYRTLINILIESEQSKGRPEVL